MSQDLAVPGSNEIVLDEYAALVEQEKFLRETIDNWEKQLKAVQAEIKNKMGDAEVAIFAGRPVFRYSYINGMNRTEFAKKYPTMAKAYSHIVEKEEIDVDLLRTAQPEIFREFQTRRFERI